MFSAWALYSKIQSRKRKFEALTAKRETTKRKVDDFLSSLGNISKTNNEWILQKVHEKKSSTPVTYSAVTYRRLDPGHSNGNVGRGNLHRSTGPPTIMCACHAMHVEHDHEGHDHC